MQLPVRQDTGRRRRFCSPACRQAAYRKRNRPLRGSLAVMGSSKTDEWPTPPELFAQLDAQYGPFTLDPCAGADNAKCPAYFTREQDGLAQRWAGRVFMNPPYGRPIRAWMRKALESVQSGDAELVVCLVPVRTGSAWWQSYATRGEITYLPGRLKFVGSKNSAPFDSAVVVFHNAQGRYETLMVS
jgi:site-specific DNA-methyltransferase (adenine-specific)